MEDKLSFVEVVRDHSGFRKGEKDYVILFKGNSITSHDVNERTIRELGWSHVSGMAASSEDKDYVHVLAGMIQKVMPDKNVKILIGIGKMFDPAIQGVKEEEKLLPDLVVVQNGEHCAGPSKVDSFEAGQDNLIATIKQMAGSPLVISIGIWNPRCRAEFSECTGPSYNECAKRIEEIQRKIAEKHGIGFVAVSPYENDPANTGDGKVAGVRWHPNDNGMKCYAEAAFKVFLELIGIKYIKKRTHYEYIA